MCKPFYYLLLSVLLLAGCKKDPSNIAQRDAYSSGEYPKSLNDLLGVLGAGYGNYRSEQLAGFQLLCKTFACSEHIADLAYGGDQSWTELAMNHLSVTNTYANDLWKGLYVGIKEANAFLDRADFYEANYMAPSELQMLNYMRGEAYFLRAFYYFNLECFFGESYIRADGTGADKLGVPVYTAIPSSLAETQQPRKTTREVWDLIIADLKQSAELLHGAEWTGASRGRATEWSAKALLGKAYVFTQDWPNAKTVLQDVINNSGKTLMPFSKYSNAFNDIPANEFNEESLFEINVDRVPANYGIFADFPPNKNLTTSQGLIWSPTAIGNDGIERGPNNNLGYCNEFVHDRNLRRFGFDLPVYNLVNNPTYNASQSPSLTNQAKIIDPDYKAASIDMRINKTVDPRLYVVALQPWVDSVTNEGVRKPVARCVGIGQSIEEFFNGWSFKKFATIDNNMWAKANAADGANYYILRLADVFLLYAEACMNSNENGQALEYINKVKRRAYGYANYNATSPVDYASLTSPTMAGTADPNLTNQPLRYERYVELFAEGHWWFDVCRWRIGQSEANYYGTTLPTGGVIEWDENRSYAFPIPSSEINSNSAIGNQNPGY
ncbi:MAG: RagB/SusD family nutrient uptake outer membrane protein [Candidatus Pseudobacter hemicellulosilyticus]|uniref:RagB/SusD family nutrient uptake outer membrane protein n=1 Tax=Candidatus Pseudobacter hemicellulosilyticus TaxID=3121375 RepID=A0AAJ6BJJ8_9BACT|nr:MAG: RagB/SusD family nutrient uptake outer membrane protein [Pseudobacter sp.]